MLPLFAICDRWDVGGVSIPWLDDTGGPTIFIHDPYPAAAGWSELSYGSAARHLAPTPGVPHPSPSAHRLPSPGRSPPRGNLNEPLDKHGAIRLLTTILT